VVSAGLGGPWHEAGAGAVAPGLSVDPRCCGGAVPACDRAVPPALAGVSGAVAAGSQHRSGDRDGTADAFDNLPSTWREVVTGTDLQHRDPVEVAADLGLDRGQERAILPWRRDVRRPPRDLDEYGVDGAGEDVGQHRRRGAVDPLGVVVVGGVPADDVEGVGVAAAAARHGST